MPSVTTPELRALQEVVVGRYSIEHELGLGGMGIVFLMAQLLALPRSGRRLIFGLFQAGRVGMLDITNLNQFTQVSVVSFGKDSGPHSVHLTHDDKRLVVTDYFLNEDDVGKIHFEGDHKVHVLNVTDAALTVDPAFHEIDFNTAFPTGPARPHGIGMK